MDFKEFLTDLHVPPHPNPDYYALLIANAKLIVYQSALTSKNEVAIQLNMSPSKFSTLFPLLRAVARNIDEPNER